MENSSKKYMKKFDDVIAVDDMIFPRRGTPMSEIRGLPRRGNIISKIIG